MSERQNHSSLRAIRSIRSTESFPLPPQPAILTPSSRQLNQISSKSTTTTTTTNYDFEFQVNDKLLDRDGRELKKKKTRPSSHPPIDGLPSTSTSSNSLTSTNSTTSSTFGLTSPFPRPYVSKPRINPQQHNHNKENVASTSRIPIEDLGPVTHIRIESKPIVEGFPYRASSVLTQSRSSYHRSRAIARQEEEEEGFNSSINSSSSEDVDLDLSFDFHPDTRERDSSLLEYTRDSISVEDEGIDWEERRSGDAGEGDIGLDARSPTRRGDSFSSEEFEQELANQHRGYNNYSNEGQVMTYDSGIGTKKRVKSLVGLRAAYFEGEKKSSTTQVEEKNFSILMDTESEQKSHQKSNGTARKEWVRKASIDPTLNLMGIARRKLDPPTMYHHSLGNGFTYNPTDPLNIPLPDSPATPSTFYQDGPLPPPLPPKKVKTFPLPLKLVEKRKSSNPLASPAWSISSFFSTSHQHKEPQALSPIIMEESISANVLIDYVSTKRVDQDLRLSHEYDHSTRNSWAGELTKTTLDLLARRSRPGTPHNRRITDTPSSGDDDSPMFGGSTPSDFHTSPDEVSTPRDTSLYIYNDIDEEEDDVGRYHRRYSDQPVEVDLGRPRSELRKDALAGLGLDFSGGEHAPHFGGQRRSFPLQQQHRPMIPSLSISPPPLSDVDDSEEDLEEDEISLGGSSESNFDSAIIIPTSSFRYESRILASPDSLSLDSRNSISQPPSPDYLLSPARPHFGTGLRGLYPRNHQEEEEEEEEVVVAEEDNTSQQQGRTRFSFVPLPLNLVNHKRQQPILELPSPILSPQPLLVQRNRNRTSTSTTTSSNLPHVSTGIESIAPAKMLFYLGLILGPWCWILGGWYLRSRDGEFSHSRNHLKRCQKLECHDRNGGSGERWGGVEKFVFINRVLSVASGVVITGGVSAAIFVAVTGA